MESRISKYSAYRADILNSGLIADKMLADSSLTREYKNKIDKINPVILKNISYNLSFGKLISVNQKSNKDVDGLNSVIGKISDRDISNAIESIDNWSQKHKVKSIIGEDNKVLESFLDEDENYQKINSNRQRLEILRNSWASFQVTSREQITKLDQLAKSQETLNTFKNLEIIKKQVYPTSSSFSLLAKLSLTAASLLILISVAIVVLSLVL